MISIVDLVAHEGLTQVQDLWINFFEGVVENRAYCEKHQTCALVWRRRKRQFSVEKREQEYECVVKEKYLVSQVMSKLHT